VLREIRVFGSKRVEVTGGGRLLHNEELHDLYSLPDIIRMMKSNRVRWAGHAAHMGGEEGYVLDLGGKNQKEKDHQKDLDVNGRITSGRILEK
jgi:hypothetical protein